MKRLSALIISCVLLFSAATLYAAPAAKLWPYWRSSLAASSVSVDHSQWGDFLANYLVAGSGSEPNRLRYAAVSAADRQQLDGYLNMLGQVRVTSLNRAEQKAYWINLYNALTVQVVLDHYPVESIREIKSGWLSSGPWDLKLIEVEGFEVSLNDIEHRILRPIWQDNRIHYAVNCASYSCPDLQSVPYTAANSERLLDQALSDYVNSERGVRFEGNKLILSQIYDWYRIDFADNEPQLIDYLQSVVKPVLAQQLADFTGRVDYEYLWGLNEQK